ncbi:MAG: hypothetical protein K8J08_00475 [Thermoanaerobaculia bacterium]|nr:hypothetical protein [Thermoanaerobaculia bacterium]
MKGLPSYCRVLDETLAYSRASGWSGFNKHDGLNSRFLEATLGHSKWTRILGIQTVMRFPWNLRPLLGVPRTRNPKGIGLFAQALLDRYATLGLDDDLREARSLLDWLLQNPSPGFRGLSWGYPYPWQDLGFFAPRHFPNRVVTCWIGFAFVEAVRQTGDPVYRDALTRIADFLLLEPRVLCDTEEMKCLTYVPDPSVTWAVMDVPALVGAFLAEAGAVLGKDYGTDARRLLNWVVDKQTTYGAWYYTHPAEASFRAHDNYHTAIILDCLDRYRIASGDESFDRAYVAGLDFFAENLFTDQGAPRWLSDREFPHDIHGAASGILCFVRAASRGKGFERFENLAVKVTDWTLANLYDRRGFFYYQQGRWMTRKFCLLRWSNGWMCRALAALSRSYGSSPQDSTSSTM